MNIVLTPEKSAVSANPESPFHVLVRVQAPQDDTLTSIPLNVAVVLDRSGSMQGAPLAEAKRCVRYLVDRLSEADRVAIVIYDSTVDTLLEVAPAAVAQAQIAVPLGLVKTGGCTDLHAGWLAGAELLAPHTGEQALSRVILLSDGQANEGLTDVGQITQQVAGLAQASVTTTTVGLGRNFNEFLMTAMAQAGQGMAHYGERAEDLFETFESELGLLKNLAWRDVTAALSGTAQAEIANRYTQVQGQWRLPAIAAGAEAWALIRIPASAVHELAQGGSGLAVTIRAADRDGAVHEFSQKLSALDVVSSERYAALQPDALVARRMIELQAAEIQFAAGDAVRAGDWYRVEMLLRDLTVLAADHPWLAASLSHLRHLLAERDQELMSKELHYKSVSLNARLSAIDEDDFNAIAESAAPSYLRRKVSQGRRTQT